MPTQGQAKRRSATQPADKPAKRTRVSRACDQCRIAREKCDGLQPTCSTCSNSKRTCSYTTNPKKRGIQPGYIRSLELALAWLFQDNPKNETSLNDRLTEEGASCLFLSRDSKESNRLHRRWRKAQFYTGIDKLLSGGGPSRHEQSEPLSPRSDDEDSDVEGITTAGTGHDHDDNEAPQVELRLSRPSSQQPILSSRHPVEDDTTFFMPSNSWRLLETYFTYTQCWLPICEKHDLLKLSYSYPAEGLSRLSVHADSGAHAELWSVLAVASLQDPKSVNSGSRSHASLKASEEFYETARALVPGEVDGYDFGHVKALLNLAIFNMMQCLPEAAWVLIGCASRVLEIIDQSKLMANPRGKHVLSGCFLLDSMLALQFGRRPYFRRSDLELIGKIDEDGLEEWQPWHGHSHPSLQEQTRAPILALSIFNNLLDIIDILSSNVRSSISFTNNNDIYNRLQRWIVSLPPKLNYVLSETALAPFTPPALLLQATYYCTALAARPSEPWLYQLLEVMTQCQERVGFTSLPPVINCLIAFINRHVAHLSLDDTTRLRLQRLQTDTKSAWAVRSRLRSRAHDHPTRQSKHPIAAIQLPTPNPLNLFLATAQPADQPADQPATTTDAFAAATASTQPGTLPPSRHSTGVSDQPLNSHLIQSSLAQSDPRYPDPTGDLEIFFDELASLDSAPRLDNQPQFMQNLGFAPGANMADLFSEYIPMQSSSFLSHEDAGATIFDQYNFYDAS